MASPSCGGFRAANALACTGSAALGIAKKSYCAEGLPEPKDLLQKIVIAGGVKGLIKLGKAKEATPVKETLPIPDLLKLIVIGPDGTYEEVPS